MAITVARRPYSRTSSPVDALKAFLDREFGNIQRALPPQSIRTVTANDVALVTDQTILVDATAGAVTVTLPVASRVAVFAVTVKKIDASGHAVTIGATVDGVANPTLATRWKAMTVQSDGSSYYMTAAV